MTSRAELVGQLRELGVRAGDVMLVHTSYRAVRPVEGGPAGLIGGLLDALGRDGTLVMPSWSGRRLEVFDPARSPAARSLGVVADCFWRLPGVQRSHHAEAFAAIGPEAGFILQDPHPLPPHRPESPVGRVHDRDGKVLLLGVQHDADTTIHLAELMVGVPYGVLKRTTVLKDGRLQSVEYRENDHCCQRFRLVDDWLREAGVQSEGPVGRGVGRLVRSRAVTDAVVSRLRREPLLFLHARADGCEECDEARASVGHATP